MAIIEDRLSSQVVDATYSFPEGELRSGFTHDWEGGPAALTDTSGGMNFQAWQLSYSDPDITLTPQDVGSPSIVLSAAGCKQISFTFDQNARPSIVYVTATSCYLYWYDTLASNYVTTEFPGLVSAILSLDDKRYFQSSANDILFWYTKETSPTVYELYHRRQRDRFETEFVMREDAGTPMYVPPYLWKAGMHEGLRGKVTLTYRVPQ